MKAIYKLSSKHGQSLFVRRPTGILLRYDVMPLFLLPVLNSGGRVSSDVGSSRCSKGGPGALTQFCKPLHKIS